MKIIDALLDTLYPPYCPSCGIAIEPERYFCSKCASKISRISKDTCRSCGCEQNHCECKQFFYRFDGVCGAFKSEGVIRDAMYDFKFKHNKRVARFFARAVADRLKTEFNDVRFDIVTSVPPTDRKTEFDHAKILAVYISRCLKLGYSVTLKPSEKKRDTQHFLNLANRFENVYNSYKSVRDFKGKTILLVDDIKTSGATLDECARQLKLAGAKKVICAAALVSHGKKES